MKLYHVSSVIEEGKDKSLEGSSKPKKYFYPRIPNVRSMNENDSIGRVCFSDSISKCLMAMPESGEEGYYINNALSGFQGGYGAKGQLQERFGVPAIFDVYKIDTEQIEKGNLLTPKEIEALGYVPDCITNSEYWVINQSLRLKRSYTVRYTGLSNEILTISGKGRDLLHTDIYWEKSIEDKSREYQYHFLSKDGAEQMKNLLKSLDINIMETSEIEFIKDVKRREKLFIIKFEVPPNKDVETVWRMYFYYCLNNFMKLSHKEQDRLSQLLK